MSDGGQTLLDVIEDPNVLDSLFNVEDSYTQDQNLQSPGFDNGTVSSEGTYTSTSLESLGFESLSDPYRSGNSVLQQVINSNLAAASQHISNSSHHLYSHHLQNDLLPTSHHASLSSPIAGLSHDINRQREPCSNSDTDQTPLQQLLSTSNSVASQPHLQLHPHHQANHVLPSNLIHSGVQPGNQNQLLQQHTRNQSNQRSHQHLQTLSVDQSLELTSNLMHSNDSVGSTLNSRNNSVQSSNQILAQEVIHPDTIINSVSKSNTNISQNVGLASYGKVQLLSGPNQVLPQNIFSSGTQIAGHVISGTSLLSGNQVLPTSSILPGSQVFQGGNIIQGTQILTNVLNNSHVVTSVGSMNNTPQSLYVSTPNASLSPQKAISLTTSSPSNTSIGGLGVLPSSLPATHTSKISLNTNSVPSVTSRSLVPSPQAVVIQKSSGTIQPVQSPTYVTQASNISLDGVVSSVLPNISMASRTPSHNIAFTQANLQNTTQLPSGLKQVVSGGQVIHLVGAPNSKPSVVHQAPKPIQPKPQILPKPSAVRQPTPPPAGKTLIGSRPAAPSNQQAIVIGTGQQSTMIGQHALGGILLNPNMFAGNSILLPQRNAPPLLVNLGPSNAGGQTILAPVGAAQTMLPMSKMQPQTIVLPSSGQGQSLIIPQGLATSLPGGTIFGATPAQRTTTPIIRYLTGQPNLQLQYQTANGPTLFTIPQQQAGLNLSNILAPGTVRAISPQMAQTPFQLAPISTASGNLGGLQIGTNFQPSSSQPLQVNPASFVNKAVSGGLQQTIIVKNSSAGSSLIKDMSTSTSVTTKCSSNERTPRKNAKKKKKSTDCKEDSTALINISDILKQSGIDNDMMFDESEFGIGIDNPVSNIVTTNEPMINTNNLAITNSIPTRPVQATNSLNSPISSIPGMPNVCVTVDHEGKYVITPQEMTKPLATIAPQLMASSNVPLQNMQLITTGNIGNTSGETIILGGTNDRGQLGLERPPQTCQYVSLPNASGGTTLMKLEAGPIPQVALPPKIKDGTENKMVTNMLLNSVQENHIKNAVIGPLLNPDGQINGFEQSQIKVGLTKVLVDAKHKQSNQILPISTMFSPNKNINVHESKIVGVKNINTESISRTSILPLSPLSCSNKVAVTTAYNDADNNNTYQHKYVESVKPPLLAEKSCKIKKGNKRRKREKSEEPVAELQNNVVTNGPKKILLASPKIDSYGKNENVPGASMPSLSFMTSPVAICSGMSSVINTNTMVNTTTSITNTKLSSSGVFSPGNYSVTGHGLRTQNQTQPQRPRSGQTIQVMISHHNQELLKKLSSQIQVLKAKSTMSEQDKQLYTKLASEYNRIISLAKPVPTSNVLPSSNSMVINQKNAIKYSHSIGHHKIILTPNQKKCYSPSVHLQAKESTTDPSKNDKFLQNNANLPIPTPAVTMYSTPSNSTKITYSTTPRTSLLDRETKMDSDTSKNSSYLSQLSSPVSSDGFNTSVMGPPQNRPGEPFGGKVYSAQNKSLICQGRLNIQASTSAQIASTVPSQQFSKPLTRDQLFEHQMKTDQNGAFNPDYKSPFRFRTDACKRLIRFHMYKSSEPSAQEVAEEDAKFEGQADAFVKKRAAMIQKYQSLFMKDSIQRTPSAEQVMLLRLINQEEKSNFERERMEARCGQEVSAGFVSERSIASSYLSNNVWEDSWQDEVIYQRNEYTNILERICGEMDNPTPDRPESEEPRLQILMEEEADGQSPGSDESIARIAKRIGMNEFSSSDSDTRSSFVPQHDSDPSDSVSNCGLWNGTTSTYQPGASTGSNHLTNGTDVLTSSSESVQASPLDGESDRRSHKRGRKRKKSKHRDRSRLKNKNKHQLEDSDIGHPESPSVGPIKLVLKKKHEGDGYYSSSQPELRFNNDSFEPRSKKRIIVSENIPVASTSSQQGQHINEVSTPNPNPHDIGYNMNSYQSPWQSNYTYRYS